MEAVIHLIEATDRHYAWMLGEADAPADAPSLCAGGVAPPSVLTLLRGVAADLRQAGAQGALAWLMVVNGEAIGLIGLKSRPDTNEVDFGYGIAPPFAGNGHTTRAVALLAELLHARGVPALTPETSIHNRASQRVLEKNGFRVVGERDDAEDGPLYLWRRELKG